MKILFSSLSGHKFTQSENYVRVLKRLGHEVNKFGVPRGNGKPDPGSFVTQGFHPFTSLRSIIDVSGIKPDMFIYIEPGGLIPLDMETASFPTACILSDTHRDINSRLRLSKFFDHVFLYHRNYLDAFTEHPKEYVHWHPYACDLELFRPDQTIRDLDVAFIGKLSTTERQQIWGQISKRWKVNEQKFYEQNEIPKIYSRAKIVINLPLADDLNFRVFEAMSCGALLITRRSDNGQELLFREGHHYIAFSAEEELFTNLEYYLTHPSERERIAARGLQEIREKHRMEMRLAEIIDVINSSENHSAPIRAMSKKQIDDLYIWLYEYWNMLDPSISLINRSRREGRSWIHLLYPALRIFARRLKNLT